MASARVGRATCLSAEQLQEIKILVLEVAELFEYLTKQR